MNLSLKIQNKIAQFYVILSLGIAIASLGYGGFDMSMPSLSADVQTGIFNKEGALISNSPEGIVMMGGSDPIGVVQGSVNPIYNSAFYSPASVRTSAHWQPPFSAEKYADVFLCRGIRGNELSNKLIGYTKLLDNQIELPIVSLMVDSKNFFDKSGGIYVQGEQWHESFNTNLFQPWYMKTGNYSLRGSRAIKPGYVQFFDKNRKAYYSGSVGVKIHGNATRSFPQKSLRLVAKESLIKDPWGNEIESLILRNGGNTWETTIIGDVIAQTVLANTDLLIQRGRSCVLLINGFYWGIHNIRDRLKASNLAIRNNCSIENVAIWEQWGVEAGNPKRGVRLNEFLNRIKKGQTIDYNELKKEIDVKEFAQYILAETFLGNTDWPTNNFAMYKIRKGKWHPIVSDLDFSLGYNGLISPDENSFDRLFSKVSVCQQLCKELLKHEEFKILLIATYDKFQNIGIFDAEKFKEIVGRLSRRVVDEIPRHLLRWRKIGTVKNWQNNLSVMEHFYENRISYFDSHFKQLLQNEKFSR